MARKTDDYIQLYIHSYMSTLYTVFRKMYYICFRPHRSITYVDAA